MTTDFCSRTPSRAKKLQAGRGIADGDGDVIDIPDNDSSFISAGTCRGLPWLSMAT